VSSPGDPDTVTGTGPAVGPATVSVRRSHHRRDPWLRIEPDGVVTPPLAGQPGHGRTAFLRRQPVRIVDGRFEGGYTDVFELICPSCGDHPYLDYSEIPPRLQRLRGPRTLEAALAAYDKHLGPPTPEEDEAQQLGRNGNAGLGSASARVGRDVPDGAFGTAAEEGVEDAAEDVE
jgi:hypothetical protein